MIDYVSIVLLCASIILSTGRNVLSKSIADERFGTRSFFGLQALIFFSGSLLLFVLGLSTSLHTSWQTVCFSVIYGVLLVSAQWNYTVALKNGKTGICSTVYSLGFIFPTIFGSFIFQESFGIVDGVGVLLVIPAIILTGAKKKNELGKTGRFFLPLIVAMLCSGGLGVMQKVQQHSLHADEKTSFMLIAFMIAGVISSMCFAFGRKNDESVLGRKAYLAMGVGLAFACCNLLNTILAGRLPSVVFFPILNVGTILCSLLLGIVLFKERLTKKDGVVFSLGALSILLITIG